MANEIATRNNNNAVANPASGNPFLQAASALGGGNDGKTFLQFSGKTGDYTYGANKDELDHGWLGAVSMNSTKRGHICWSDSEVVGESMTLLIEGNPTPKNQLEDHGPYDDDEDGWSEQFSIEIVELKDGEELLLKNSSKSGLRAFGNLLAAYGKAIQKGQNYGDDGEELHPVVEFDATEFTPKNGKKKDKAYAPKFTIVDWISDAELEEKFGGAENPDNYEQDDEPETPPVKAAAKKTTAKPAKEEPVEEAEADETETPAEDAPAEGGRRRRRF